MRELRSHIALTALTLTLSPALTHANIVVNPSFEDSPSINRFTGWTSVSVERMGPYINSPDGNQSVDLATAVSGWIDQTLITVPGEWYTLSFALSANIYSNRELPREALVWWDGDTIDTFTWNQLGTENPYDARFERHVVINLQASSSSTRIRFQDVSETSGYGAVIDDVSVTLQEEGAIPVPMPNSFACGLALLGLASLSRRSR